MMVAICSRVIGVFGSKRPLLIPLTMFCCAAHSTYGAYQLPGVTSVKETLV